MPSNDLSVPCLSPDSRPSLVHRVLAPLTRILARLNARTEADNAADLDPHVLRDMGLPPEVDAWNEAESLRRHRSLREPQLW